MRMNWTLNPVIFSSQGDYYLVALLLHPRCGLLHH